MFFPPSLLFLPLISLLSVHFFPLSSLLSLSFIYFFFFFEFSGMIFKYGASQQIVHNLPLFSFHFFPCRFFHLFSFRLLSFHFLLFSFRFFYYLFIFLSFLLCLIYWKRFRNMVLVRKQSITE